MKRSKPASVRLFLIATLSNPLCWLTFVNGAKCAFAGAESCDIRGSVFTLGSNGIKYSVTGVTIRLSAVSSSIQTVSDENGSYRFSAIAPGSYRIDAKAPGLVGSSAVTVVAGTPLDVPIQLNLGTTKQSLTVNGGDQPAISTESSDQTVVSRSTVLNAPNKYETFDSLLPLVPGVVRGPDGLINMKGARASQTGSLLNSAAVTDPATGNPAMNLPIDVVESVRVIANPYDPEYGRLAGAVSSVETMTGNFNDFHLSVQNLLPRPRKRSGDFIGLEAATPRLTVTGPLVKNKIAFTQSFEYRFIRIPVSSLPQLQRDIKLEGFNSFSQMDVNLTERQSLTATFALYPQKYNYLGLNTFTPQPSTPDLHQRGYMGSIQHRYATGADSLFTSQFTYKRFDADTTANSNSPYELFVETTEGGFFDRQRRNTSRIEWQETYHVKPLHLLGSHQIKIGIDVARNDYQGRTQFLPVTIFGITNVPVERIAFGPASRFDIDQNDAGWFIADKWMPWERLSLDIGLRFDHDSVTSSTTTAPRGGFALLLTKDAKTLLKGGAGLFYDRVPLNVASFPLLPNRTALNFDSMGQFIDSTTYVNTITGPLRNPRSVGWNVEVDRQITSALTVRAGFEERNTVRDFVMNPQPDSGILSLSNTGRSFYREFQLTGRYTLRRHAINASYVRSRAYGDLNDFNQFFGNSAVAVIEPNARGQLPFDVPNRFLFWGQFQAPFKLTVLPVLDVHTGFPYSEVNQDREFIGPRDSQRFPWFDSFDMQVTRPVVLPFPRKDIKARIGFSVYNLFNHFNPRDVQNDIDSERFGAMFNGVGRTFRGKFVLEF